MLLPLVSRGRFPPYFASTLDSTTFFTYLCLSVPIIAHLECERAPKGSKSAAMPRVFAATLLAHGETYISASHGFSIEHTYSKHAERPAKAMVEYFVPQINKLLEGEKSEVMYEFSNPCGLPKVGASYETVVELKRRRQVEFADRYFSYMGYCISILVVVDSECRFMYVYCGRPGSM